MRRRAKIIGIQVHHSVLLHDAMRGAMNACAGVNSARVRRPEDPELERVEHKARELARDISQAQDAWTKRLRALPKEMLVRCRDGETPYPDEPAPWFDAEEAACAAC